jgi:hypothetical protein
MPYKKSGTGGGSGSGATILSNTLTSSIDTTNPLLPKLKLKSSIDEGGIVYNSNELLIDLEPITSTGGISAIATTDSASVDFTGDGTSTTPLTAVSKVSTTAGNALSVDANGLYVATPTASTGLASVTATDTSTIDFSGNGTAATPLTAVTKISATAGNAITANTDGLYTPIATSGISTDLGNRLILGTDAKPFENISGHLVAVYSSPNSISFQLDPRTAKPTAASSAGTHTTTDPISSYTGGFAAFNFEYESAPITLPVLPAGYSYKAEISTHCLIGNRDKQPYDFIVQFKPSLQNSNEFGGADNQSSFVIPAIQSEYNPTYTNNPSGALNSYSMKNMDSACDLNARASAKLSGNVTKFQQEMVFVLPCHNGQAFTKFLDPIGVSELKYEISFFIIKDTLLNLTAPLTTPILIA